MCVCEMTGGVLLQCSAVRCSAVQCSASIKEQRRKMMVGEGSDGIGLQL